MQFATPVASGGSGFDVNDHEGQLLLIFPTGWATGIDTSFGPADACEADIALLSGDAAGTTFENSLIFQAMRNGLRKQMGQPVLARLGRGEAKKGQSAPWILLDPTADDIAAAERWVATADGEAFIKAAKVAAGATQVTTPSAAADPAPAAAGSGAASSPF